MNLTLVHSRVGVQPVLAVGFNGKFECYLTYDSQKSRSAREELHPVREFGNPFICYRWLERYVSRFPEGEERFPFFIAIDLDHLIDTRFMLVQALDEHPRLWRIPVIVVNRGAEGRAREALHPGVDDCYEMPLRWDDVKKRAEFLWQFKPWLRQRRKLQGKGAASDLWPAPARIPPMKRLFDIAVASMALLLLSPLMLLIALAIKLESRGPVIYVSKRAGQGYRIFDFYKFRSMYVDADKRLAELAHLNRYEDDAAGPTFLKLRRDPRVTRVGRFLRKTSLDELPQLFNVLKGDMSIVGNRPLPLYEAQMLTTDQWAERFLAPAGLTGLWQVRKKFKKNMSSQERIRLDAQYARACSFLTDLKIMLQTLPAVIQEDER